MENDQQQRVAWEENDEEEASKLSSQQQDADEEPPEPPAMFSSSKSIYAYVFATAFSQICLGWNYGKFSPFFQHQLQPIITNHSSITPAFASSTFWPFMLALGLMVFAIANYVACMVSSSSGFCFTLNIINPLLEQCTALHCSALHSTSLDTLHCIPLYCISSLLFLPFSFPIILSIVFTNSFFPPLPALHYITLHCTA
jgi:hypothetical protein